MNKDSILIAQISLKILITKNWEELSLVQIKKKSKIKNFDKIIKNKDDVIKNIILYIDHKLIFKLKDIEDSNDKDMIFEIFMMRFDILQKYRKAILNIFNSLKKKTKNLINFLSLLLDSVIFMIGYTKISTNGIVGQLKIKGVLIIYLITFLAWSKDTSPDLEKTMIALDKYLDQTKNMIKFLNL